MSASRRRTGAVPLARGRQPEPAGARSRLPAAHTTTGSAGLHARLGTWLARHAQACVGTAGGLARRPVATLMTVTIIGIALALPAGLHVAHSNLLAASGTAESGHADSLGARLAPRASVYLAPDIGDDGARALAGELRSTVEGAEARVITREEALAEYREMAGFGPSLEALGVEENPLPAVVVLTFGGPGAVPADVQSLVEQLEARPEVEMVQMDLAWLARLDTILELLRRAVVLLSLLFGLGVLLIAGGSVRLAVERRSEEIEIARLFGATAAFVRRPFLYAGALYGLLGGLLALALVTAALFALETPVSRLAALYASGFELENMAPGPAAVLLAGAAFIGVAGAWISVAARLRAAEPG